MTDVDSETTAAVLGLYVRIAIKRGMSARQALMMWRVDGGHVTDTHFYRLWRETKDALTQPGGKFRYDVHVRVRDKMKGAKR